MINKRKRRITAAFIAFVLCMSVIFTSAAMYIPVTVKAASNDYSKAAGLYYANVNLHEYVENASYDYEIENAAIINTFTKASGDVYYNDNGIVTSAEANNKTGSVKISDFCKNLPVYANYKYEKSDTFGNYRKSKPKVLGTISLSGHHIIGYGDTLIDAKLSPDDVEDDDTYDAYLSYETAVEKTDAFTVFQTNILDKNQGEKLEYTVDFTNEDIKKVYENETNNIEVTWFKGTDKEKITKLGEKVEISLSELNALYSSSSDRKATVTNNNTGEKVEVNFLTDYCLNFDIPEISGAKLSGVLPCFIGNTPASLDNNMYLLVYSNGTAFFMGNAEYAYSPSDSYKFIDTELSYFYDLKSVNITDLNADLSKKYAPNLKEISMYITDDEQYSFKINDRIYPVTDEDVTLIDGAAYKSSSGVGIFYNNKSIKEISLSGSNSLSSNTSLAMNCPQLANVYITGKSVVKNGGALLHNCGFDAEDGLAVYDNENMIESNNGIFLGCKINTDEELPMCTSNSYLVNGGYAASSVIFVDLSKNSNIQSGILIYDTKNLTGAEYTGSGRLYSIGTAHSEFDFYFDKDCSPEVTENMALLVGTGTGNNKKVNVYAYYFSEGHESDLSKTLRTHAKGYLFPGQVMYLSYIDKTASLNNVKYVDKLSRNLTVSDIMSDTSAVDFNKITGDMMDRTGTKTASLSNLQRTGTTQLPYNTVVFNQISSVNFENADIYEMKGQYYDITADRVIMIQNDITVDNPRSFEPIAFTMYAEMKDEVISRALDHIEIVNPPEKINYEYGEAFDKKGMIVNAVFNEVYESGRTGTESVEVTDYQLDKDILNDTDNYITVSYTNEGITKTATQEITVSDVLDKTTLESILVYSHAVKKDYKQGEAFDRTGLSVDAVYKDIYKSGKEILRTVPRVPYYITDEDIPLDLNKTYMEITFTDNGITKTVNEAITVNKYIVSTILDSIYVDKYPDNTIYKYGEVFNDDGMKVNAVYKNTWSDGSITMSEAKDIKYLVDHTTPLTLTDTTKTISYTDNNVTKTVDIPVTVNNYIVKTELNDINIRKLPDKTKYLYGDTFDKTGMIVDALYNDTYADGSVISRMLENVSVKTDKTKLYDTDTDVTIFYTDNNVTKLQKINVTVNDAVKKILLDSIKITRNPDKTVYEDGEIFDSTGMEVNAFYKNIWLSGKETYTTIEKVAYDIINKDRQLSLKDKKIEAAFTDKGITKTDSLNITVNPIIKGAYLDSITIRKSADKTEYLYGEFFDETGMIVDAYYKNIWSDGNVSFSKLKDVPFSVENKNALSNDDYFVIVSYTDQGVTKTAKQPVLVNDAIKETVLDKISIATPADKTLYYKDEVFDKKGLTVNAIYKNIWYSGRVTKSEIKNVPYNITDAERKLDVKDTFMGLTFTDNGVSRSAEQNINVINKEISVNEQKPDEETKTEIVNTADNLNIYYYLLLLTISAGVMISLKRIKKCEKI